MTKFAHLIKRRGGCTVIISDDHRPVGAQYAAKNVREARKIAAAHGAAPYNF